MTLYDLTKKYSAGRGEDTMWETLDIVSHELEKSLSPEKKASLMRKVYGIISTGHYNEEFANHDIEQMYYVDTDGEEQRAPYWPEAAVKSIYEEHEDKIPDYGFYDFMVTMNMIYSDSWCMLRRWFPGASQSEMNNKVAEMTVAWLKDDDWPTKTKIWDYLSR